MNELRRNLDTYNDNQDEEPESHPADCSCFYCVSVAEWKYAQQRDSTVTYQDILDWHDKQHEGELPL